MTEFFIEMAAQWGLAGIALAAAGYVIWTSHRDAKEKQKLYEEKILGLETRNNNSESLTSAMDRLEKKIDDMGCGQEQCHARLVAMEEKISDMETRVGEVTSHNVKEESERLVRVTKIAPSIHTLLTGSMKDMRADHVFVALLHNGTRSITGIPFMKMDVIVEKYDPLKNLSDVDYATSYKDEDLMNHDKMPGVILQNDFIDVTLDEAGMDQMKHLDMLAYRDIQKIGTKRIMFECIRDIRGIAMGFICAYSYTTADMSLEKFRETAKTLERIYRDVCE
jgi:hypothetical protein